MTFATKIANWTSRLDVYLDKFAPYYSNIMIGVHVLYIFAFFGIQAINESYLNVLHTIVQIFICVFLMIKFHPYRKYSLKPNDPVIIFGSATFLLLSLGLGTFVKKVANKIDNSIMPKNQTTANAAPPSKVSTTQE